MIFDVELLAPGRYRLTNTLTGIAHVTYGTEVEVLEQAALQSRLWAARVAGTRGWKRSGAPARGVALRGEKSS